MTNECRDLYKNKQTRGGRTVTVTEYRRLYTNFSTQEDCICKFENAPETFTTLKNEYTRESNRINHIQCFVYWYNPPPFFFILK